MLTIEQSCERSAATRARLERLRQTNLEELAQNFDTCRNLAAHFRHHNLPQRFIGHYQRRAKYWWQQFGFALADELNRDLFTDEVDAMVFLYVGSGTP